MDDLERSPGYADLLRDYVQTFEELEVVLALARTGRGALSVDELVIGTTLPEPTVQAALAALTRRGLVRDMPPGHAIDDRDPQLTTQVAALLAGYQTNRVGIMAAMATNALMRVRTSAVRAFARAFLLGHKDDR